MNIALCGFLIAFRVHSQLARRDLHHHIRKEARKATKCASAAAFSPVSERRDFVGIELAMSTKFVLTATESREVTTTQASE